ncbi:MAG: NUDIX hydrolase [Candidatus Woesearchaeota archaeon]|jgi:ADP-ribose pyrophosphatase YjhB (NUDIX family)|nr:NUDIX hydrolase [Candidatus Woesearchaeota archaeon]MDP7457935.1 NUDIX hydrolase [Candidatus Woesearchaeota archaeon]
MSKKIVFEGKIFQVVQENLKHKDHIIALEYVTRAPGVRVIVVKDDKILLNEEIRHHPEGLDYRLPGGKVFDLLSEFKQALDDGADMKKAAEAAGVREVEEETGMIVSDLQYLHTNHGGATVRTDIFYFSTTNLEEGDQKLEPGEEIKPVWKNFEEVKELCFNGGIKEDMTVAVLFRFLDGIMKKK